MRVLFDTNVILDHMLARKPYADVAEQLLNLADTGSIQGVICATTATTIHYLASRALGPTSAVEHLRTVLAIFEVALVDREVLLGAIESRFPDFEDAVLHEAASRAGAVAIVTRNGKDFAQATLPIMEPVELLAAIQAGRAE